MNKTILKDEEPRGGEMGTPVQGSPEWLKPNAEGRYLDNLAEGSKPERAAGTRLKRIVEGGEYEVWIVNGRLNGGGGVPKRGRPGGWRIAAHGQVPEVRVINYGLRGPRP